jgi:hypothetical protein
MTTTNEVQPENNKPPVPPAIREVRVVTDTGPLAYLLDTSRFEHAFRLASAMAAATLIPDHLRQTRKGEPFSDAQVKANCFRIVNQALRWGVDPWSIVDDTYVVGGKLCYQSKVVAALINTKAPLQGRLKKSYSGTEGQDDFTITISGTFTDAKEPSEVRMSVGYAKTENQLWRKNPRLKLWYSGVIQWAREYTPELIVGIFTDDDAERMDSWRQENIPQGLIQSAGKQGHGPIRTAKPDFSEPKKARARVIKPDLHASTNEANEANEGSDELPKSPEPTVFESKTVAKEGTEQFPFEEGK